MKKIIEWLFDRLFEKELEKKCGVCDQCFLLCRCDSKDWFFDL